MPFHHAFCPSIDSGSRLLSLSYPSIARPLLSLLMKFLLRINMSTFLYWRQVQKLLMLLMWRTSVFSSGPKSQPNRTYISPKPGPIENGHWSGHDMSYTWSLNGRWQTDRSVDEGYAFGTWSILKQMCVRNFYCHRKWNMKWRISSGQHLNNNVMAPHLFAPQPQEEKIIHNSRVM